MSQINRLTPITNEEAREAINRELTGAAEWDIASWKPGTTMLPISSVEVATLHLFVVYSADHEDGQGLIEDSIWMTLNRCAHDPKSLNVCW